jgi:hypothetical protein
MKTYELITEKHQPPCSGNPVIHDFAEIETDDPIAYVKAHTKNATLDIENTPDGSTVIIAEEGEYRTKFVFSEI